MGCTGSQQVATEEASKPKENTPPQLSKEEIRSRLRRRRSTVAMILSDDDLQKALSHPAVLASMKTFLDKTYCSENLVFYAHVADLKKYEVGTPEFESKYAHIVKEFVVEQAPQQVNIKAAQRKRILESTQENRTADVFDEAQQEVYLMIRTNNWKPFCDSPDFDNLAERKEMRMTFDFSRMG